MYGGLYSPLVIHDVLYSVRHLMNLKYPFSSLCTYENILENDSLCFILLLKIDPKNSKDVKKKRNIFSLSPAWLVWIQSPTVCFSPGIVTAPSPICSVRWWADSWWESRLVSGWSTWVGCRSCPVPSWSLSCRRCRTGTPVMIEWCIMLRWFVIRIWGNKNLWRP